MSSMASPPPGCNRVHNGFAKVEYSSCVRYFYFVFNVCCYVLVRVTKC
jgi:hypothetical protein